MNKILLGVLGFTLTALFAQAQTYNSGSFSYHGETLPYRYLKPEIAKNQKLPLVIFLHGAGERGNDNEKQLAHGSKLFSDSLSEYPALVIFPQCDTASYWPNVIITKTESGRNFQFEPDLLPDSPLHLVDFMIDSLIQTGTIDPNRIYVGGLSMGGMGTYALAAANPDVFAAAFAICGAGNTDVASTYARNTPFWIFHGALDDIVPVEYAYAMDTALTDAGGNPILTIFPKDNHNSWDSTFAEPGLLKWLFSHTKTTSKQ